MFFAPIAAVSLSAARPGEHGKASGVTTAVRELAVVLGVALLASVLARSGGYGSAERFAAGFEPALWVAAVLAVPTLAGPLPERAAA